ncbi:ROK family protein [Salinibacterium sp. M195]|uniref:ROK family protein n=1 Tax=Salinibacterium sp. M195 TaxID=2583374 RepID=UPI001C629662|nr:ROK family protein [Salinibacterium sp. M195]
MSRPALSKATGLSKITVDGIANELVVEGRVLEAPEPPTGSPGRRARLLAFREDSAFVGAIDIGATRAQVAVSDLAGTLVAQEEVALIGVGSGSELVELVRSALQRSIAAANLTNSEIRALCIATPGIVDPATQRVTLAPQLPDWDDVDLVSAMSFLGDCPIHVENEVHLAVLGEQWRGAAQGFDDVAYVHLGVGVGLGIVKSGTLIRGAHGGAGEIGYLPLVGLTAANPEGNRGRFEALVGGAAYHRAAQELCASGRGKALIEAAGGDPQLIDAALLYRMAESSDPDALEIVEKLLGYTAAGIASVISILDPEVVIIGGGISRAGAWMLERIESMLGELTPLHSDLLLAGLGDHAVLVGACRRAIAACEHELLDLTR